MLRKSVFVYLIFCSYIGYNTIYMLFIVSMSLNIKTFFSRLRNKGSALSSTSHEVHVEVDHILHTWEFRSFSYEDEKLKSECVKGNRKSILSHVIKDFNPNENYYSTIPTNNQFSSETWLTKDYRNEILFLESMEMWDDFFINTIVSGLNLENPTKYKTHYNLQDITFIPELEEKIELLDLILEKVYKILRNKELSIAHKKRLLDLYKKFEIYVQWESHREKIEKHITELWEKVLKEAV